MKKLLLSLAALSTLAAAQMAGAVTIFSSTVGGSPIGNAFVTFDSLPLGAAGGSDNSISVSFTGSGRTVQGSQSGVYAAPVLSAGNGADFGQPDGKDSTRYLSSGVGSVILDLETPSTYFGLL